MEESVLVDLDQVVDIAQRTFLLVFLSHGAHTEMTVDGLKDNRSVKDIIDYIINSIIPY